MSFGQDASFVRKEAMPSCSTTKARAPLAFWRDAFGVVGALGGTRSLHADNMAARTRPYPIFLLMGDSGRVGRARLVRAQHTTPYNGTVSDP
jgi:hypothetical protein